jgi:hypothetical protein
VALQYISGVGRFTNGFAMATRPRRRVEGGRSLDRRTNALGHHASGPHGRGRFYDEPMLDLVKLDLDEIAMALSDQTDYEHRWLIDPRTGEIVLWTSDTGIDGKNPADLDELDLLPIGPLASAAWYGDMVDFAEGVSNDTTGRRLAQALRAKGAYRRFKDELYDEYPNLVSAWQEFRDVRAKRRAVEWLLDQELMPDEVAQTYLAEHPDPPLP